MSDLFDRVIKRNPPLRVEEIVGSWLREKGDECVTLKKRVAELEEKLAKAQASRTVLVETMAQLATVLALPYPDPKKVLAKVEGMCLPPTNVV